MRRVKLNRCQNSPLTLHELAAAAVERLRWPVALYWSEDRVIQWLSEDVGLPEYRECIGANHINGRRLLMLEDPSVLPMMNIHNFEHIKEITAKIREVYSTDFIRFARSVGLPTRKPLTLCTWFKTRTGPSWGIRNNWNRCGVLRWMKILGPESLRLDHWDLVWHRKPDFPKTMWARTPKQSVTRVCIPQYVSKDEPCREYTTPRKFRIQQGIPENEQYIWMECRKESELHLKRKKIKPPKVCTPKETHLMPKKVSLKGLQGDELLLARRVSPKPKFFPKQKKAAQIL